MSDKVFVDTNILVYLYDQNNLDKKTRAERIIQDYGNHGRLMLSTQVLQEFYVTVTRHGKTLLSKKEASEIVGNLAEFPLVQIDKDIIKNAMTRHQTNAFSFWDSLIVEAALQANCTMLFSEDMQAGFKVDAMEIYNPFAEN